MKRSRKYRRHAEDGAALMLALWALFVLSAMIMGWAMNIDTRLAISGSENRVLEARAMACSGAEVALHPAVSPASPVLRRQVIGEQGYEVRITGEGGRLNINWVVAGENPQRIELLRRFLELKGIELNDRDRMIDTLLDWVDADNLVRLKGAEAEGDYRPANTLLLRVTDLKMVRGWEKFTARGGWEEELTVNSSGPIDLAWAPKELMMALPGLNEGTVEQFIKLRAGDDGIDGTEDDAPFESIDDVRVALGLSAEQFSSLAPLVSFRDQVLRVVSVGRSGDVTRAVHMVIRKTGATPQLITWKEL